MCMMNLCFLHTGIAAMLWPMKKGRFPLVRGGLRPFFFVLLSQSEGWSVAGNRQVVCNVTF